MLQCISCKKQIENDKTAIKIFCPVCGEQIMRCGTCKKNSVAYKCKCGFEGP
ncbi:MAG: zinc finger domain-containing protein [Candidatus Nanoarchaeia archaeon]